MKITLIVDNREKTIIPLFNIPFTTANLEIGDFQFLVDDQLVVLIERKSYSDLSASIIDGRYREQKKRILSQGISKVIYLLEGNVDSYKGSISKDTVYSTIVNCTLRDNIQVLQSNSIEDSVALIEKMYRNLHKYEIGGGCSISYQEASVKQKRNKNLTPSECYLHQLSQIPGISYSTAKAIAEKYSNMMEIIDSLSIDPDLFVEFRVNNRKLGKKGYKIYEYLFQVKYT